MWVQNAITSFLSLIVTFTTPLCNKWRNGNGNGNGYLKPVFLMNELSCFLLTWYLQNFKSKTTLTTWNLITNVAIIPTYKLNVNNYTIMYGEYGWQKSLEAPNSGRSLVADDDDDELFKSVCLLLCLMYVLDP